MDNSMDRYLGKQLDSRYEIMETIGVGGMAVVYKAKDIKLNRFVAVKVLRDDYVLDKDLRRRFQTESQAVAMLSHPNIVSVYDVSSSEELEYIVMELIEGITLKQYMQKKGALSWKEVLHFSTQMCKALDHAHGRGIIHRDIKPHNIMLLRDGTIKIADFGIARLQDSQNTLTQQALGSVHYISPEQARGEPVDARTDIYSVGIVMYEMLTGELPFDGDTPVAVAVKHINETPRPPSDISADIPIDLEDITLRAMSPFLENRYSSVAELLEDLENFKKQQSSALAGSIASGTYGIQPAAYDEDFYVVKKNVQPVSTSGELSREAYERRRVRSNKVSLLAGFFCVGIFLLVVFVFLWNFLLKGLFEEPERITVQSFVNSYYDDIANNPSFTEIFNFTQKTVYNADYEKGLIIDQSIESGKSLMLIPEGIDIELTVSAGIQVVNMPDVVNRAYIQVKVDLEKLGLVVNTEYEISDSITKDYVIRTEPQLGAELTTGAEVTVVVSSGPDLSKITVPNLVGMTEEAARELIESSRLSVGNVVYRDDAKPKGTVIWQNIDANTEVEEHTQIVIQVSTGVPPSTPTPSATPTPSDSPTPTATPTPTPSGNPEPPPIVDPPNPETPVDPQ